jgi:glycosyltransferase involved in cell wall biosynthesis
MIKRIPKLRYLKKHNNYDACISFMDSANIVNIITGKKYCRVIVSERNNLSERTSRGYRYIVQPFARLLYSKADYMVSLSKGVEEDLIKNYNVPSERSLTIYNGYDIDIIKEKAKEPSPIELECDKFYFITVGRLCEQKGQWHLIKAFREVVNKHPESRLVLCGRGPYFERLQELTCEYGIEDKVIFAGYQTNPFAIISKCDVFVFPSMYEGFGNVIVENMACGLPAIVTDFRSGAREILAPKTDYNYEQLNDIEKAEYGIIVPVCHSSLKDIKKELEKEEKLLAKAMLLMLENDNLRKHYSSQSVIRAEDFSIARTVEQWLGLVQ